MSQDWAPGCSHEVLKKRAWMLSEIREYFRNTGVLEVDTPLLGQAAGSDPALDFFCTDLEFGAASRRLFLQTSPEFAMKRLLASGSGSIYQICKAFRNGERGRHHNPEFSILEWYRCGANLMGLMADIEALLYTLIWPGQRRRPAERISYASAFSRACGIDPLESCVTDFSMFAAGRGFVEADHLCGDDRSLWQEFLFSHCVQPDLGENGLTMVYDYPPEQAALARIRYAQPDVAERVEVFLCGMELANGFNELTDACEQEERFERDLNTRKSRGQPLPPKDTLFLQGLKAGLPDCAGVAVGLDRLLMLITGADSIDQVLCFTVDHA